MGKTILRFDGISKSFPGVRALDQVSLSVQEGTVHALIGENGAGKSTLMKVLFGLYKADSGTLWYDDQESTIHNPSAAIACGISMIPQEVNPVNNLSVSSNIFLGKEMLFGPKLVNQKLIDQEAVRYLEQVGLDINPRTLMKNLSIASSQLVAIATAISDNSRIIIMDEPTSALTEKESNHLLGIIKKLREQGVTVIYISHKLDELMTIADTYTVLRDGQSIESGNIHDITKARIISLMVGRAMDEFYKKKKSQIGDVILSVRDFSNGKEFKDISFDLRKGEILGFAGLIGAGRSELMEAIFGLRGTEHGILTMRGKRCAFKSPIDAIEAGIGFVTEDRKESGIFPDLSIMDNMIMPVLKPFSRGYLIRKLQALVVCGKQIQVLNIKTPSTLQRIKNLSGGNQQKVLLSRWLLTDPDVLILDEPTRGIDVGSKAEIHKLVSELAASGKAIILISSEMPEIISMSDRILVMHEGRNSGVLTREQATQETIMHLATGETVNGQENIK